MDTNIATRVPSEPSAVPAVRLSLESTPSGSGMLDGGWWPRSDDPMTELPALITALDTQVGTVFRIALNRGTWHGTPRRITVAGRVVKLGWYGPADVHAMSVSGSGRRNRLDLLVVPPGATAGSARAALATAADGASPARASAILAAHGITGTRTAPGSS